VTEGSDSNSKRLASRLGIGPYSSLPEGLQERPDFVFYHLYFLSRAWVRQAREMREFGINLRERLVLEMLYTAGKDGIAQHVIGDHFAFQASVISQFLDRLEKHYFITRNLNPCNKKEKLVCLTEPYGRDFVRRMLEVTDAHTEEMRAALPDGELREFTRVAVLVITEMEKDLGLSPKLNASCKSTMEYTNV
jgi:DNA-binding MarR family transcriptional regulator